jgi:hypothetical protein
MREGLFKPVLIGSLALLVGSAQFFTYGAYVRPRTKAARDLQALTDILQLERQKKANIRPAEDRGVTVTDLLSRVQEIAAQNFVTLTGVEAVPADPEQFKLGLVARYEGVLGFLARFETLRVSITGFDISRAMDNPGSLIVSLNFRHTQSASPIGDQRIKQFEAQLRSIALRDPFDPAAGNIRMVANANTDDLTYTYHLTSISLIGNTKYATIDGRDYNVGDHLQGLVVSAIGNDNVTLLDRENGKERQRFLRFRGAREDRI